MGILDLLGIKNTFSTVKGRLAEIESEIAGLEKKRFEVVRQPLPYDDFIDWVCEQIDPVADYFPRVIKNSFLSRDKHLRRYMEDFPEGYNSIEEFNALYKIEGEPITILHTNTSDWLPKETFYWIFREQIKAGIRSATEQALKQDWPKKVGTKRSVRLQEIAKLDNAIEKLDEERHKIHDELEGLGVKF